MTMSAELIEQLAAIEHTRWAEWQSWCHQLGTRTEGGDLALPSEVVARWDRQIITPYDELSEAEKQSDRDQVERYRPLIEGYYAVRHAIAAITAEQEKDRSILADIQEEERINWSSLADSVGTELRRQRHKWGSQHHAPNSWYLIAAEEFGEVAKALCERDRGAAQNEIKQSIACLAQLHYALGLMVEGGES